MMKNKKPIKVQGIFTLSKYEYGRHTISGPITDDDIQDCKLTFSESLSPIASMLSEFKDYPLGTKLKVSIEIAKEEEVKKVKDNTLVASA